MEWKAALKDCKKPQTISNELSEHVGNLSEYRQGSENLLRVYLKAAAVEESVNAFSSALGFYNFYNFRKSIEMHICFFSSF